MAGRMIESVFLDYLLLRLIRPMQTQTLWKLCLAIRNARLHCATGALLPSQEEARDNFLFLFRLHQDETYTELVTLEELAECLDAFFFAGALTGGGGGGRRRILRCLELEQDIFAAAPTAADSCSQGDVHAAMPLGASRLAQNAQGEWGLTISIDPDNRVGMPSPLHNLLETLIHEMAHSFLRSFICSCASCLEERTAGLSSNDDRLLFTDCWVPSRVSFGNGTNI